MTINWRTSTFSGGNGCVEVGWRKSTFSGDTECVEVSHQDGRILLRDSKLGDESPVLAFTREEWDKFLKGAEAGEFAVEVLTR